MTGWIPWQAEDSFPGPLPDHVWCQVLEADGDVDEAFAGDFNWSRYDWAGSEYPGVIVAYRVPELSDPSPELTVAEGA